MSDDPYGRLLPYYDAENAGFDEDIPFYMALVDEGDRMLDIGCGTGRVSLPLAQQGVTVIGVDRSAAMLDRARQRAQALGLGGVHWLEGSITTLELAQRVDLCAFPYNGFMHLLTQADQITALRRMAALTHPEGTIAIDLPNPLPLLVGEPPAGLAVERIFTDARGHHVIQHTLTEIDRAAQHMHVTYVYDHTAEDGLLRRDVVPMQFRLVLPNELHLLARAADIEEIEVFGDYDYTPFEEDSPRLVAVMRL